MFQIRVHGLEEEEEVKAGEQDEKQEEEDKLFAHAAVDGEKPPQQASFLAGNPQVRVTTGKLRFYRPDSLPYAPTGATGRRGSQQLPTERNTLVCVVSVPPHMPPVEILEFLASFLADISLVRILKDPERGNCMALMQFTSQERADQFFTVSCLRLQQGVEPCWRLTMGDLVPGAQWQVLQLDRAGALQDRVRSQHRVRPGRRQQRGRTDRFGRGRVGGGDPKAVSDAPARHDRDPCMRRVPGPSGRVRVGDPHNAVQPHVSLRLFVPVGGYELSRVPIQPRRHWVSV